MLKHIFVGIDLGDKNSVGRIAVDREKTERFGFVNNRRGRARLFSEAKRRAQEAGGAKIVMAYEASSCGFVLHEEAEAMGICCWVLAPTKMEKSVEQRQHKNDDRELVRGRVELGEKQTQVKSQIQMLLKRHGVEKASGLGAGWTVRYRRWLEALTESEPLGRGGRQTLGSLLRQLSFIEGEIERMQQPVERLADEPRHKPIVDELRQECGVGLLTAMVYRTEIGYAGRFRRGRQTGKYVGLTPTSYESGEQNDRKGHISRQGPPRLRKMLCQASWSQVCHDVSAKRIYQQLVSRNPKKKKIAIVAVMRRLAVRLWHRMRKVEVEMGLA